MLIRKKTAYITMNAISKQAELEKTLEPNTIWLGEVGNSAIFACKENLDLPDRTTSSIRPKQKCKIPLYNNKNFH
jgi:hypothetical protein